MVYGLTTSPNVKLFQDCSDSNVPDPQSPISYSASHHRRSQDFLWGALFFREKVDDFFLVVAVNTQAKTTKLTTPTVHISQISFTKRTLALPGRCMLYLGVHLQLSPVNLAPKFFSLLWGALWLRLCFSQTAL